MATNITNLPNKLTPADTNSFAYETVKQRVPEILTKVIDTCSRNIQPTKTTQGDEEAEDMKQIVSKLSKLRSEIMTNKPMTYLEDDEVDTLDWNIYLKSLTKTNHKPSWFSESWMFLECYFYRQIMNIFHLSKYFKTFDPFDMQKTEGLKVSFPNFKILLKYLDDLLKEDLYEKKRKEYFSSILLLSLWGNKFDLSLSAGVQNQPEDDPLSKIHGLDEFLLINEGEQAYELLKQKSCSRVDIVLDNAGFEICSDFILAEYILSTKLAEKVIFHPKTMPWFVSDVTYKNFFEILDQLTKHNDPYICKYGKKWVTRLNDSSFTLAFDSERSKAKFWTMPYNYNVMAEEDNNLYKELSKANLIIFKGDLNYRKLVGDRCWSPETPFTKALQGFKPAPLLSLRALKADVVVGLNPGQAEKCQQKHPDWMITGKYAVISYQA